MDVVSTRIVIVILGLLCGGCLGGSIALESMGITTPQILVATIASSTGAIVGILVKTPNARNPDLPPAETPHSNVK